MALLDWIVVAAYAIGMLAVGRYYGRRNETAEDYHLGGRRMSPFAVGLSLFATLTSSLSYLAVPGEMVKNGPMVLARFISVLIGIRVLLISLLVSRIEGNLVDLCYRVVNLLVAPLFVLFFLAIFVKWATTFGALFSAVASVAAAVFIAFSESFGFGKLSILLIMPGSFVVGAVAGSLASLLPIGQKAKASI